MKSPLRALFVFILMLIPFVVAGWYGATAEESSPSDPVAEDPKPVHRDGRALEQAVLDATLAYMREDAAAARQALDRADQTTRRLDREKDAALGSELIGHERAFRITLDRAREAATRGDMKESFNQFVWLQRACIACHATAREQGLLPPAAQPGSGE